MHEQSLLNGGKCGKPIIHCQQSELTSLAENKKMQFAENMERESCIDDVKRRKVQYAENRERESCIVDDESSAYVKRQKVQFVENAERESCIVDDQNSLYNGGKQKIWQGSHGL